MFPYTPFTSETLTTAGAVVNDLSSVGDVSSNLPSGKQVIFFGIGFVCVIGSIALISRALIGDSVSLDTIKKVATVAA
jgi:hypothetical protein